MPKTAGIIIIGDEILTGKVHDENSFFMAKELRDHGVELRRISVIPDETEEIGSEVKKFSSSFDYVFTSGGIGPTHDDITIEGIAKAFGVKSVINEELRELLSQRWGRELTPERLKMAEIPEGAELIKDDSLSFPLIHFMNVFIFPGIPELLRKKFFAIEKLFTDPPLILKKVYVNEYESEIAVHLNVVVRDHKEVKIGSYPASCREYRVMITLEASDEANVIRAVNDVVGRLPQDKIVRIEG